MRLHAVITNILTKHSRTSIEVSSNHYIWLMSLRDAPDWEQNEAKVRHLNISNNVSLTFITSNSNKAPLLQEIPVQELQVEK